MLAIALVGILFALAQSSSPKPSGPTKPVATGPGGGVGGGGPAPPKPPAPPSGSSGGGNSSGGGGGGLWSPRENLPKVAAVPFPTRGEVAGWQEGEPFDAPKDRHDRICSLLDAGRLDPPSWVRIPVRGGLEVEVMSDVLSFGGVRLVCSMRTAQAVADSWGCLLVTAGISDAIWRAATVRVAPRTMDPNPGGAKDFMLYQSDRLVAAVAAALAPSVASGVPPYPYLVDTLGKDYVLDPRLAEKPSQCAIFGWHNGKSGADTSVIQSGNTGASFKHQLDFFDYSQTVRLVRRAAWLNGSPVDLATVYKNQQHLVSFTGAANGKPIPTRHPAVPMRGAVQA